ncbi:hypothetical protein V2J09_005332 [Rumex salicifolius]
MYTYSRGELIAIKGLPFTGKFEIAKRLGEWSNCPVLYIDDFLDAVSFERGFTVESPPSRDEAERLHRLAFDILCHVANSHLAFFTYRLIIKSRLCSKFEIDQLVQLAAKYEYKLIIVECVMENERRWEHWLSSKVSQRVSRIGSCDRQWFKPRSWKDIENAMDEYDGRAWDLHVRRLINAPTSEDGDDNVGDDDDDDDFGGVTGDEDDDHGGKEHIPRVKRLMLNVIDDLDLIPYSFYSINLTQDFLDVIQYLIKEEEEAPYAILKCNELRRLLLERKLASVISKERSKYLCSTVANSNCVFKYTEATIQAENVVDDDDHGDDDNDLYCGVCEERVVSGESVYTCYFCILTLHKSCAELNFQHHNKGDMQKQETPGFLLKYSNHILSLPKQRACQSCMETTKQFFYQCNGCYFETHLITRRLPTVISHECHREHFLSMRVGSTDFVCRGCGACLNEFFHTKLILARLRYGCYICKLEYHLHCALGPQEVKHKHGGYEHTMKRMYSHDVVEKEEDYWCDICYRDLDPQVWFYWCKECPYYIGHLHCALKEYYPIQMQDIARYT